MEIVAVICHTMLALSALLYVARVAFGPSLADRVIALDCLLITGVVAIGVEATRTRSGTYLDVLLVVALVAFIGTTAVARFIERQSQP